MFKLENKLKFKHLEEKYKNSEMMNLEMNNNIILGFADNS